jgi:hypothetical protein
MRVASALGLAGLLMAAGQPAYGYTDPGSGALIWQMLVAGVVGAAFYFRRFTSWLKRRTSGAKNDR